MPYIKEVDREKFDKILKEAKSVVPKANSGELNYLITSLIHEYLMCPNIDERGYQRYSEVISALECAKLELYRRDLAEYEEKKRRENGDVGGRGIF